MILKLIIDCINIILFALAILICISVLIFIFLHIRPLTSNVPILLTCNNYISLAFVNIMMLIIYIYNFYGDLYLSVSVNDNWCQIRGYLTYTGYTILYYSCLLQAIFRLFRVIFYKQKRLQSSLFFLFIIIFQWIISFLIPLSNYLRNDYQYMPLEYRCWISFQNSIGLFIALLLIYFIPLTAVIIIYFYLIRYVRRTNQIQRRRLLSNERDILVLKRIVMCVFGIYVIGMPTTIIWLIYMLSNYSIPLTYHIQGLTLVLGLFYVTICFIFITPQIQNIFKLNRQRILPITTGRSVLNTMGRSVQQNRQERF